MYRTVPAASVVMPYGPLKRAALPTPSAEPYAPAVPASVVTVRVATSRRRIVWLLPSATNTVVPAALTASPVG